MAHRSSRGAWLSLRTGGPAYQGGSESSGDSGLRVLAELVEPSPDTGGCHYGIGQWL